MKHSLYSKFLLIYFVFAVVSFCVVALVSSRFALQAQKEISAEYLYSQARKIAEEYSGIYREGSLPADMRNQVLGLQNYGGLRTFLVSTEGKITFDSAGGLENRLIQDFDPSVFSPYYQTGRFFGLFSSDMLSVLAPITADFNIRGYVVLHCPLTVIRTAADRTLQSIYLTAAILFVLSLSLLLLLRLVVIGPLREITEAARDFGTGNLNGPRLSLKQKDEIGYLANTLNLIADDLVRAEEYQKHFIANVSHDFRSPLTSIKGYLNAIIDGTIPQEGQEKYLNIVIHETERLENLTQSMLSLNSLDRQNMHLEYSDFDVCRLIRNVCRTFEGKCLKRSISFDLFFSSLEIPVHADMGRIQQVLYNLIDNAVKFSPDDSSVIISVQAVKNRALISVKDHGIGIPKEDLKQIWTRFFKSDSSRGKDKRGTGLGLSIVKEIITAHAESIDVVSTEGVGTEFTFRLPLASHGI